MPSLAGATQDEVRRSNLSTVLRLLHLGGAQSRSHLTAVTGLNRSTVGDLVSTLAALGLVLAVRYARALVAFGYTRYNTNALQVCREETRYMIQL